MVWYYFRDDESYDHQVTGKISWAGTGREFRERRGFDEDMGVGDESVYLEIMYQDPNGKARFETKSFSKGNLFQQMNAALEDQRQELTGYQTEMKIKEEDAQQGENRVKEYGIVGVFIEESNFSI